jgi:hypothetical protein
MLSIRRLDLAPARRGVEIGGALSTLLPFYSVCGLAMLRAAMRRRRHRLGRDGYQHVTLQVERPAGRPDRRPVAG